MSLHCDEVEGSAGFEPAVILSQVGQVLKRPRIYLEDQPGQPTTKPSDPSSYCLVTTSQVDFRRLLVGLQAI